ncbi:MAG TPA: DNA ligase D [Terracidiphilus sp.]|jgi:bifunctional non-homologous end joining protein LigD|nr:DNA ligase D [Terracidiphilus sp.]
MAQARRAASSSRTKTADKQLQRYRSMRDFHLTREPSGHKIGKRARAAELPFVIQKHAATRLHYDFRLGWNGVLKSWAVTKGPSYFPGDKRLAVQVEDHPMEYGGFEGIIPEGQYGGGTVMLWDRGTWEPHVDVEEGLRKGSLKFALHGKKMKGNWALVRMHPRPGERADKPNWLLIKEHDEQVRAQDDTPITEAKPKSVLTGRDMDAIARAEDRVWQSNRAQGNGVGHKATRAAATAPEAKPVERDWSKELRGAAKESLPKFISPQLASLAKAPPAGDRWVHEIKLDGYRIQIRIDGKKRGVQLLTRTGLDWTHRMKDLANAALRLPVKSALIDGEVVVLTKDGTSSFAELQAAFQESTKKPLIFFAFDLLHLDGHNLRGLPLLERKRILAQVLANAGVAETIRLSEHIEGDGKHIFAKACELGTEGIISKLADGKCFPGRGSSWLKVKCYREQELVIGGFTLPANGIHGVGALLLGYYRDGELIYAGKTGTGFTQKTHRLMRDKLDKLRMAKTPFARMPRDGLRDAIWVKPELVAQVSFSTWTADRLVRQAAFKGLREDKPAKSVVLEEVVEETRASAGKRVGHAFATKEHAPAARRATKTMSASKTDVSALPVKLSHPDKVLDASTKVTKEQLARYYWEVSEAMLPYVSDRPLTLVRCVEGSGKPCFYQKHRNQMLKGLDSVDVVNRKTGEREPYITLHTREALVQLAQIGVLEVHPWGSRNETMEQPDRIVIDLDPDPSIAWLTVAESAKEVRKRLRALGLKSFVKTTGGKGLHVVIPIRPEHEWPGVKQFAHDFVLAMERDFPKQFLTKMTKSARAGKIFLDYLRNDRGATAVAPYSPRARAGLPVAMPLSWSELDDRSLPRFEVSDIQGWRERLARDPWKEMLKLDQRLTLE